MGVLPLEPQPVLKRTAAMINVKEIASRWRGDEEAKLTNSSGWQSEVRAPHPGCPCLRGQFHGAGSAFGLSISPNLARAKHRFVAF